ncbi:MAG TPA: trimeric intracellular cation channel family protein [Pirellulaceae bacterium]|jgi:uncharacterized membrane protein YeiH|nr:trimeric intracellular cation channel family protein [Pirellulaceae bacterium]
MNVVTLVEFAAVVSSAIFGVLLGSRKQMDFVGLFSMAFVVAFGGGTLRDLFLDRTPLFWIEKPHYPAIVFGIALIGALAPKLPGALERWLTLPDALGLGLFAVIGVDFARQADVPLFPAALIGTIAGTFGGVIADIISNEIPSLFRPSTPLYATCAFLAAWTYLGLSALHAPESVAYGVAAGSAVALRLAALQWNIRLTREGMRFSPRPAPPDDRRASIDNEPKKP